jgi:hypothetical protein
MKPGDEVFIELEHAGYLAPFEATVQDIDSEGNVKLSFWMDKEYVDELEE